MTKQQRLVLTVAILASFVVFLDGSVVNVALPALAHDLGGGLRVQQWVVDAYLLTLGSLILVAGSISDLFGRKRVIVAGLIGFGITSVLCAVAPTSEFLIGARALQGVAGALLVPSSLALIIASFSGAAEGKAIGTWTAWTGISFIFGPLLGGFLVDAFSWRLVFAINMVPILLTLWLVRRLRSDEHGGANTHIDVAGAVLCALGLGGPVYALIQQPHYGWGSPMVYWPLVVGLMLLASFVLYEAKVDHPMMPLEAFKDRNFSVGNVATFAIYGGLSVAMFLVVVFVQQVGHYSALAAGVALMPVTLMMFFLSSRFGTLAGKHGPRLFMAVGPMVAGAGFLLMLGVNQQLTYWSQLLPGILVFGLGLSMTVAPLTFAVLARVDRHHAGEDSAINNAIARIAGLLAVAAIGVVTGPQLDLAGFHRGVVVMAALLVAGGVVSAVGIVNPPQVRGRGVVR